MLHSYPCAADRRAVQKVVASLTVMLSLMRMEGICGSQVADSHTHTMIVPTMPLRTTLSFDLVATHPQKHARGHASGYPQEAAVLSLLIAEHACVECAHSIPDPVSSVEDDMTWMQEFHMCSR